jgi:hypothetical protein
MELDVRFNCRGVDWQVVAETLKDRRHGSP